MSTNIAKVSCVIATVVSFGKLYHSHLFSHDILLVRLFCPLPAAREQLPLLPRCLPFNSYATGGRRSVVLTGGDCDAGENAAHNVSVHLVLFTQRQFTGQSHCHHQHATSHGTNRLVCSAPAQHGGLYVLLPFLISVGPVISKSIYTRPIFARLSGLVELWLWMINLKLVLRSRNQFLLGLSTQLDSGVIWQMALAYDNSSTAWVLLGAGG